MGEIYSNAMTVTARFGSGPEELASALRDLSSIFSAYNRTNELDSQMWWTGLGEMLHLVCANVYWTHIWIVQEVLLTRDVEFWCGGEKMKCRVLSQLVDLGSEYETTTQLDGGQSMRTWRRKPDAKLSGSLRSQAAHIASLRYHPRSNFFAFRPLFSRFSSMQCLDARDRVYALLSLVDRESLRDLHIPTDYSMSMVDLFVLLVQRRQEKMDLSVHDEPSSVGVVRWMYLQKHAHLILEWLGLKEQSELPVNDKRVRDVLGEIQMGINLSSAAKEGEAERDSARLVQGYKAEFLSDNVGGGADSTGRLGGEKADIFIQNQRSADTSP